MNLRRSQRLCVWWMKSGHGKWRQVLIIPSSFSHPTLFKSIPLISFQWLPTSQKSKTRGLSVSEPELSISDTKPKLTTVFNGLYCYQQGLSTNQQVRNCLVIVKKLMATNYFITLAKGSCNNTVISLASVGSTVCSSADWPYPAWPPPKENRTKTTP